jgi:predicted metal-binding membrane protein
MSVQVSLDEPRQRSPLVSDAQKLATQKLSAQKLTAIVIVISTIAWLAMVMLHGFSHISAETSNASASWLMGWVIMVVAMMMPPALPFLQAMQRLTRELPRGSAMVIAAALAFLATWTVAGLIFVTTGHLLAHWITTMPWLVDRPDVVSGFSAILVGAYQLSSFKQACLTACRSPVSLMLVAWNDAQPWRSALNIGLRYASVCIGCCWSLMLLTWVVGAFVLPMMVVVSVIMLLERLLPSVRPLVPLQAAFACAIGILLMLGSLPPGLEASGAEMSTHHNLHHNLHHTMGH